MTEDTLLALLDECTTAKEVLVVAMITDNDLLKSYISIADVVGDWVGQQHTRREAMIAVIFEVYLKKYDKPA